MGEKGVMPNTLDASPAEGLPTGRRVLVIGAAGNLGRRVTARALASGHDVTAFARSRASLEERWGAPLPAGLTVLEGDAADRAALAAAMRGQDAVVSTAGNAFDGERFVRLFDAVVSGAEAALGPQGRIWMMAGVAALDFPGGRRGLDLPGVPRAYRAHGEDLKRLERSSLAWTLVCPGPMVPAADPEAALALRVSRDVLPVATPDWLRWAPGLALALFLKAKVPEMTVTYEDVARVMVARLWDASLAGRRIGLALPPGRTARKAGWRPGQRSAVE